MAQGEFNEGVPSRKGGASLSHISEAVGTQSNIGLLGPWGRAPLAQKSCLLAHGMNLSGPPGHFTHCLSCSVGPQWCDGRADKPHVSKQSLLHTVSELFPA